VSLHETEAAPEAEITEPETEQPAKRSWTSADSWIVFGYVLFAFVLFNGLWLNLGQGYLWNSASDQNMWEWFFSVTADNVLHLRNPLISDFQNYPLGVNMMSNTAMLGLSIPLTPVTLTFGPTVTWAIALTGGIAGTAAAWYHVLSRHLVQSRVAAAIGGAFCGFAPSVVSHANAHPNFVAWFLMPFIALKVIRLSQGVRPVRNGVILGFMLAYQIFLGEEPLFIGALTFVVFGLVYVLSRPREVPSMLRPLGIGVGIAAAISLVLVAFPLWWQFFGPQSYQTIEHGPVGNDTAAFTRFATQSIAGDAKAAADVSMNRTEENAFFGWPLIVLMVVVTIWLWRDIVARAMAIAMFAMAWLSTGQYLIVAHDQTEIPGPWLWFHELPLFDSVLESRYAMGSVFLIGTLLALATDRVFTAVASPDGPQLPVRLMWVGAVVAVLLPIAPTELVVKDRPRTPLFFTDGTWRQYVGVNGTLVTVPLPSGSNSEPLHWQIDADLGFKMPEGYFIGPNSETDRRGRYGAIQRPTSILLDNVKESGVTPQITDVERAQAVEDLRYWNADVLVLPPRNNDAALRSTVDLLLNVPSELVGGVWVWDVQPLTP
jgi:hypothetical protein